MRYALCTALLLLAACGGTPPADTPDDVDSADSAPPKTGGTAVPAIEAEVGALDEDAVKEAVAAARGDVEGCFKNANAGMDFPIIAGDIEVVIRIASDGSVRWIHPSRSTLGHFDTERCIQRALEKQSWPKPEGGEDGIARVPFGIDPPGRPAVDLSPAELGPNAARLESKLRACKSSGISVTLYVDADGKVLAAGAAVDDESGIDAISCAVDAAKSLSFASPGSYPAKVSVRL